MVICHQLMKRKPMQNIIQIYNDSKSQIKPYFQELHNLSPALTLISTYSIKTQAINTKITLSNTYQQKKDELILFKKSGYKNIFNKFKKEMQDEIKDEAVEELISEVFEDVIEDELLNNLLDMGTGINLLLSHLKENKPKKATSKKSKKLSKHLKNISNKLKLSKYLNIQKKDIAKLLSVAIFTDKAITGDELNKANEIIQFIYQDEPMKQITTQNEVSNNLIQYQTDDTLFQTHYAETFDIISNDTQLEMLFKDIYLADNQIQETEQIQIQNARSL